MCVSMYVYLCLCILYMCVCVCVYRCSRSHLTQGSAAWGVKSAPGHEAPAEAVDQAFHFRSLAQAWPSRTLVHVDFESLFHFFPFFQTSCRQENTSKCTHLKSNFLINEMSLFKARQALEEQQLMH